MKKITFFVFCLLTTLLLGAQDTVKTYWSNNKLMSAGVESKGLEQGHWI